MVAQCRAGRVLAARVSHLSRMVLRATIEELAARQTRENRRATQTVMAQYNDRIDRIKQGTGEQDDDSVLRLEALEWEQHFRMREESNLDMTFEDFWKSYEMDMKPKLKENTWNTKEAVVKSKILPYFRDRKMKDIKAKDIITWQNKISAMRGVDGKPFKPTYLKTIQSELSALFNHAVRFYELKENPVIKAGPLGKGKADEMNFWTKEEYLKFIEAVKDKPVSYYAFQILYWCGLRLGELLALCASDIDTKNKVLHITKSYQRIGGKDVITDPKTPKSKRDVSIPDFLCVELEQYLGMLYGYMPTDRIFQISKSGLLSRE